MDYISTKEASAKWGISSTRVSILANQGRIPGAQRIGGSWLIPAGADKPAERKGGRGCSAEPETDNFSFPLYLYRPDWNSAKEAKLSAQQKSLLAAEIAVQECRFEEAYPILETILAAPEDICTEIGALWNAAICCITMNKPDVFPGYFLRLQMLLSQDFPHRDDLAIILDALKTFVNTISSFADNTSYNTNLHEQCLPIVCILFGYVHMTRETIRPGTADADLLEINLRYLKSTGAILAAEYMHLYLAGIYFFRRSLAEAEKHAKAAVQVAFDNRFYFPLVTYYRYFAQIFSPILAQYPADFQAHFNEMFAQYEQNFTSIASTLFKNDVVSMLTEDDLPYIRAVLQDLSYSHIANKIGVSTHTVRRKLDRLCEKLSVKDKKELSAYLHRFI